MGNTATRDKILSALMGGEPMSCREIMRETELTRSQANAGLYRLWRSDHVLRTAESIREHVNEFRGRGGKTRYLLPYHRYLLRPEGVDEATIDGMRYVGFSEEHLDPRGGGKVSKASRILGFLEENRDEAFFSSEVVEAP